MNAEATRSVLIILPDDALLFEAVGMADIFHQANLSLPPDSPLPRYKVHLSSVQRHRVSHGRSGVNLLADSWLGDLDPAGWDTVIVTGRGTSPPDGQAIAPWIAQADPHCQRVVSVCTGAFHLAQAGLLKGRRATTHWKALEEFARVWPQTEVEGDPIFV